VAGQSDNRGDFIMTQKAVETKSAPATTTSTATGNTGIVPFDPSKVKMSEAPPTNYKRADTGAEGFFRGEKGDVLHGVLIGPAHEGLAGDQYLAGGVPNPLYPKVVVMHLLSDTIGTMKENEDDKSKSAKEFKAGQLLYVNVYFRAREQLTMPSGTAIWMKVTESKKIDGGKTLKVLDISFDTPAAAGSSEPALGAGASAPALASKPS
jgi:hypothetical protein